MSLHQPTASPKSVCRIIFQLSWLYLFQDSGLFDVMNLIITSDHGMATIQERIHLADHVDLSSFDVYGSSPVILVWPHEGMDIKAMFFPLIVVIQIMNTSFVALAACSLLTLAIFSPTEGFVDHINFLLHNMFNKATRPIYMYQNSSSK